jgi:hypothetical protein
VSEVVAKALAALRALSEENEPKPPMKRADATGAPQSGPAEVVAEAEGKPQSQPIPAKPTALEIDYPFERCRACRSWLFWVSIHGAVMCSTCHPPANPDLVRRWFWLPEGECERTQ